MCQDSQSASEQIPNLSAQWPTLMVELSKLLASRKYPWIFVCHPFLGVGDQRNFAQLKEVQSKILKADAIPITPQHFLSEFGELTEAAQREMGWDMVLACNEVWVFGGVITHFMDKAMDIAHNRGIPVFKHGWERLHRRTTWCETRAKCTNTPHT